MAPNELEVRIVRELGAKRGLIEGLASRLGIDVEAMEQAVGGSIRRRYVSVVGPPNQNSDFGKDVDELRLLPHGADCLRTQR